MVSEQDKKQVAGTLERFRSQLEGTAERHRQIIQQILWWTERQPFLTQTVCDLILQFTPAIPAGEEVETVKMLVQTRLIQNWETQAAAKHLKEIRDAILQSDRRAELLELYRQILQLGRATANDSPEQQELLKSGLVALGEGQLGVSNRIYQEVFNLGWVNGELANLDRSSTPETLRSEESAPGQLPKLMSAAAFLMFLASAFLYLQQRETPPPPSLPPECISSSGMTRPEHIDTLENIKTEMGEEFPAPCQDKLDEFRYDYAIEKLASNGKYQQAGEMLCQITETYYEKNKPLLEQYFRNWSENSDEFRNWLEGLDPDSCPTYKYLR